MNSLYLHLIIRITALSLLAVCPLRAQEQAERLFDNATTFINAGKFNEALTDLDTIINSFGQSPWASKALLTMGIYYLETESDYEKAMSFFSRIQSEYAQSEEAPAALFYKSFIIERQGETNEELESAAADLIRMQNLYPGSIWEPGAQFLFGKLALRLGNYLDSLKNFQKLEFNNPNSSYMPQALLNSALAAWLDQSPKQTALLLSRLQARFPSTPEADLSASLMRLLDRFAGGKAGYELDPTFFGSSPKTWSNPGSIVINSVGLVGIAGQKSVTFAPLTDYSQRTNHSSHDLEDLSLDRDDQPLLVYRTNITNREGQILFSNLATPTGVLKELRSAAIDGFGRLLVVDDDSRDVIIFSKQGKFIRNLGAGRSRLVRAYGSKIWVSAYDGSALHAYDAALNPVQSNIGSFNGIVDFCLDVLGNMYILSKKGQEISVYDNLGRLHHSFDLKAGTWPMKQASSIGVDAVGAIYLSDRRSGAVYRFH